jgi:hypothetical protein
MFSLFGLCLLGHSLAGCATYCDDQQAHQQPALRYPAYVTSSHFWASVFENWESEFSDSIGFRGNALRFSQYS